MTERRSYYIRALVGGLAGVAVSLLLALLIGSISLYGGSVNLSHVQLAGDKAYLFYGSRWLAALMQLASMFGLGTCVGLATLPFAETWTKLLPLSLLHFGVTGGFALLAAWPYFSVPTIILLYLGIYLGIWLIRWVAWYFELAAMRQRLGLTKRKGG